MKRLIFSKGILVAGIVACTVLSASGQGITAGHILHGGTRCDHVIRLIHQYGVNNSVNIAGSTFNDSPLGGFLFPASEWGDLQILQINQIDHGDPACGPKVAVTVQNNSIRKVCNFQVTAVAILGRICPASPNATVSVAEVLPGQALEVHLQLPIDAPSMGNRNGQILGFQRLLVAIDSFDELMEVNEANNLQAFNVADIPVVAVAVTEDVVETTSGPTTDATVVESTAPGDASIAQSELTVTRDPGVPTTSGITSVPGVTTTTGLTQAAAPRDPDVLRSAIDRLSDPVDTKMQ